MSQADLFVRPVSDPIGRAARILDVAIRRHKPVNVFAMFSGGHDSVCAAHVASQRPEFSGCVHINTGIGIEKTREFVRLTCQPLPPSQDVQQAERKGDCFLDPRS